MLLSLPGGAQEGVSGYFSAAQLSQAPAVPHLCDRLTMLWGHRSGFPAVSPCQEKRENKKKKEKRKTASYSILTLCWMPLH